MNALTNISQQVKLTVDPTEILFTHSVEAFFAPEDNGAYFEIEDMPMCITVSSEQIDCDRDGRFTEYSVKIEAGRVGVHWFTREGLVWLFGEGPVYRSEQELADVISNDNGNVVSTHFVELDGKDAA